MARWAGGFIWLIWITGIIAASPGAGDGWSKAPRAFAWPFYITWIEVGNYMERIDAQDAQLEGAERTTSDERK